MDSVKDWHGYYVLFNLHASVQNRDREAGGHITPATTEITDSKYLQQGITVYLVRWQRRGWRNSRGEAIANRDLWERLASVSGQHETKWRWVRGHGFDPNQDRCDGLAKESARSVTTGGTAGELAA